MGKYFQQLPERIQPDVEEVTKTSGLPQTEDSIERIAKAWLEKRKMFDEQIAALKMEETGSLPKDNLGGALLLTYSGSLLSLGTSSGGKRRVEYASIGLRKDVPDIAASAGTALAGDIAVGQVVSFIEGPIKSSSPLFKIAVCGAGVGLGEQEKRIREATIFLTNGFVKINRTHLGAPEESLGQFTMKSMASYVAQKNGLSQKQAKQVIEDFLHVVGSGALLGERVAPRKAREAVSPKEEGDPGPDRKKPHHGGGDHDKGETGGARAEDVLQQGPQDEGFGPTFQRPRRAPRRKRRWCPRL